MEYMIDSFVLVLVVVVVMTLFSLFCLAQSRDRVMREKKRSAICVIQHSVRIIRRCRKHVKRSHTHTLTNRCWMLTVDIHLFDFRRGNRGRSFCSEVRYFPGVHNWEPRYPISGVLYVDVMPIREQIGREKKNHDTGNIHVVVTY